jgi:cytochrome c553
VTRRGPGTGARRRPSPAGVLLPALLVALLVPHAGARAQSVDERFQVCLACHGADGRSRIPDTPSLGGQPAFFVVAQLFLFREGRRDNEAMVAAAKGLSNDDLRAFAERVTRLPAPPPPEEPPDPGRFARGRALSLRHPCGVCHNPDFSGREQMPRLANQREEYLLRTMREYQSGKRLGYGGAMAQELAGLTDQNLADLAHFLAHQPATR